jgi:hypothetical protein
MDRMGINKKMAGELLGHGAPWVSRAQKEGTSMESALACNALYAGLGPFINEATSEAELSSLRKSKRPTRT